ncbi:MAG: TonB-dependent receptor [Fluviicola sp.]|nr:MAG: TonB-dependent receptor [Fluviicola sp.]
MVFFPLVAFSQSTVQGIVSESNSTVPIIGVKVIIDNNVNYMTTSDVDGNYIIKNVPSGEHIIIFTHAYYDTLEMQISVKASAPVNYYNGVMTQLTIEFIQHGRLIKIEQDFDDVIIRYVNPNLPTTYKTLESKEIEKNNYGQDLPYLLQMTPSTVVTSDAGAGIGYTGIRIRGVDPTRTNVTLNGVPLNDPESHGVYWVNLPDFSSSADQIQVQRGVGTSSNGVAAFGASININTNKVRREAYARLDNTFGTFNTLRNTVNAGTGLINGKFLMDARLSRITSDGYIDRSSSNLKSFYLSGAWLGKKSQLRANIFSGKEVTYQSWYGTPESVINGNEDEINAYADRNYIFGADRDNLLNAGRTYNFYTYENEEDNYQQDHYQLLFSHRFTKSLQLKFAGHYTRGRGYYEQFKTDDDFSTYGFDPVILGGDTVTTTDVIRRRWLDNHFYGGIFTLSYKKNRLNLTWGGGMNQYLGKHYGEVIWAEFASTSSIRDRYYENDATKTDLSSYLKATYEYKNATFYGDIQFRHIDYAFLGVDDIQGSIEVVNQQVQYNFLNPKVGFMYDFNYKNNMYASVAVANREPVRNDFRENTPENRPDPEQLINTEIGYRYNSDRLLVKANAYHMYYNNQLILTGQINDVGGYTRTNVDKSYRLGLELEAGYKITRKLNVTGNITFSQNKVAEFNEYIDNYDVGGQDTITHLNTDLAFSPNIISSAGISYEAFKGFEINLLGKYVSSQFLDNTSTETRKIDGYFISNLQLSYTIKNKLFEEIRIGLAVNNLFNKMYQNNGYTWGYIYGGERTVENFYYPQAGRNFLTRLTIKF